MTFLLAIDQGTTSTRCVIYDEELNIVKSEQKEYPLLYPVDGWVEVDPNKLLESVYDTLDPILDSLFDIACVGIANQRETTLVWDSVSGEPIYNGIVWQDRRTADYCSSLKEQNLEQIINKKTGLLLDPYFSATKISWILDNVEGAREKALKDINTKREMLDKQIDDEINKAEQEINTLRDNAPDKINKIAIETSSELIQKLIGAEVNNSSLSAIVDDLSRRNGAKYYGN